MAKHLIMAGSAALFLFAAGSVTFLLCDRLYHRLILRYRDEWRKKLWRGHH